MRTLVATHGTDGDALAPGWSVAYGSGGSGTVDIQSNRYRLSTGNLAGATASAGAMSSIGGSGRFDILVRITPGQTWATNAAATIFMGDSFTAEAGRHINNGWRFVIFGAGGVQTLLIQAYVSGSQTNQVTFNYAYTGSNAVWARANRSGNEARIKLWDDGTREPEDWTLSQGSVDGARTGPWFFALGTVGTTGTLVRRFDFDNIIVDDRRPIKSSPSFRRF